MGGFKIDNLSFAYPGRGLPALDGVSLNIKPGEFIALCGKSGSGKTTLLRLLKPSLAPHGALSGAVRFENTPLSKLSQREASARIGFVMQSPENQIVTDKVWHELAFGLESLGLSTPEIRLRVAEMASFFGIQAWFHKGVNELSGGQKQILALASVMALQPSAIILDEPTSRLDQIAASEFLAMVGKINRELGVTVIVTEHRLEEVFPLCDRVLVMQAGRIIADGAPRGVGTQLKSSGLFLAMPAAMRIWAGAGAHGAAPVSVRDGREWLAQRELGPAGPPPPLPSPGGPPAIEVKEAWFKYAKDLPDVIKGASFIARAGEITAILGGNGTGKSTLLALISGLRKPYRGSVSASAPVRALPQDPQTLFTGKSVAQDLQGGRAQAVAKLCELSGLLDRHPYDLSGGEQQRLALAKVLLTGPRILLLDEPTKGLDAEFKQSFAAILKNLAASGVCIVLVSHDIDFCAEHADRCALFFDGGIVTQGAPREFFAGNSFYAPAANRIARHVLPHAVTVNDVVLALGGTPAADAPPSEPPVKPAPALPPPPAVPPMQAKRALPKRTLAAALIILLAIPATIYLGPLLFGDRRYFAVSLLIIAQTMIPFALVFEGRKPQARELVIIAVLCAIAVAGRAAFFMLPQFKPMIAVVIIAGAAFGGESGFFVGASAGFVSNMFFGQGPWTPWQMFAFGIIGFIAGIIFSRRRGRIALCVYGGLATLLIYGVLLDASMVLMYQPQVTPAMLVAAFAQGLSFNVIHAAATVVFLAAVSRPMLDKLDRIKIKYGLL